MPDASAGENQPHGHGDIRMPPSYSATENVNNTMELHPPFQRLLSWVRVCHATGQLGVNLCSCRKQGFVMAVLTDT